MTKSGFTEEWLSQHNAKLAQSGKAGKRPKYGNTKTVCDGVTFDSKAEATRWQQLEQMQSAGLISELQRQVAFVLAPSVVLDGRKKPALRYFADAVYRENGALIVEDTKSAPTRKTPAYRIKRHLMLSVLGLEIREHTKRGK